MTQHRLTPYRPTRSACRSQRVLLTSSRRGFTLVELMVVIVIIALLVGLIMPAIFGAMTTARNAEVRTEISQLEAGISSFKTEFGVEPPSNITLYVDQAGWDSDPRSKAIIRRIWPQFNFAGTGGGGWTAPTTLNGAECLVFFLGGVRSGTNGALTGFSKNPSLPFGTGGPRVGPFFEFDISRLVDVDSNQAPEYKDTLPSQTSPYFYFSSYDGRGYRLAEVGAPALPLRHYVMNDNSTAADLTDDPPFNPNSYQIVSPGADGTFGNASAAVTAIDYAGGIYDPDDESTVGEAERDNITNFTGGRLVP